MKTLKLGILLFFIPCWIGCHDVEIGYLITEYAGYGVDSLVIRKELDTREPVLGPNPEYQKLLDNGYTPDLIKLFWPDLEPEILLDAGEDYLRVQNNQPWTGSPIEGIEGTAPIWAKVKSVSTTDGDADKLLRQVTVRGNGVVEVPLQNDIPVGRYLISLTFWNEGWSKDIDDCFTIIVK